jgi:3',5'-cyclic AMP phosphodiesterase CpdA
LALLTAAVVFAGCQVAQARVPEPLSRVQDTGDSVVIAAAGDLTCGSATPPGIPCWHAKTADLVKHLKPNALLLLGDVQYETGSTADFQAYFEPAFGDLKSIIYPVPGNHEYFTPNAAGYFDYFNGAGADSGRAGLRSRGFYSFDLGAWHIVGLNSNCEETRNCGARSAQLTWLRADLAAHPKKCTLAFMHSAPFSSGEHGNDLLLRDMVQALYDGGVDVVLSGHDHTYERFKPQDARGKADDKRGIRFFVVGTGGKGLARFLRPKPNSEIRDNTSIGVLTMVLRAEGYSWRFRAVEELPLDDSGDGECHD